MKRATAFAERAADVSLRLVATVNLLFVAAFLVAILAGVATARSDEQCRGDNLLAEMERSQPDLLAEIRREAEAVENAGATLWRIEADGKPPSWLYGTMHMSDPRVVALGEAAQRAFDRASTLVIETTDVLDQSKMMAAMLARPDLMMFTDGTTLGSLLPEKDREAVEDALRARGIPLASVQKMKPWMIASMVALPACELARKAAGAPVLDIWLAEEAKAAGKDVGGLETVVDQLGAMASLPMEFHMRGLVDTLRIGDRIDDVVETMIALYLDGDTGAFWPFFRAALPTGEGDAGFAEFEETMVTARNRTMAARAGPFIDAGGAFIAVGALHLPGEEGIVALLRKAGYTVTAER